MGTKKGQVRKTARRAYVGPWYKNKSTAKSVLRNMTSGNFTIQQFGKKYRVIEWPKE